MTTLPEPWRKYTRTYRIARCEDVSAQLNDQTKRSALMYTASKTITKGSQAACSALAQVTKSLRVAVEYKDIAVEPGMGTRCRCTHKFSEERVYGQLHQIDDWQKLDVNNLPIEYDLLGWCINAVECPLRRHGSR